MYQRLHISNIWFRNLTCIRLISQFVYFFGTVLFGYSISAIQSSIQENNDHVETVVFQCD